MNEQHDIPQPTVEEAIAAIKRVTSSMRFFSKEVAVASSIVDTAAHVLEATKLYPVKRPWFRKTYNRRPMTKQKTARANATIGMTAYMGAAEIQKILSTPKPKWPLGSIDKREAAIFQKDPEAWEKEMLFVPDPHDTIACTAMQLYEEEAEKFDLMNYEQVETRFGKCNGRRLHDRFIGTRPNMEHIAAFYGTTVAEMKQHSRCIEYERKRKQLNSLL